MNSPITRICVCLVVSTTFLASCDKKPLTASQYVSRANSVCQSVGAKAESPPAFTTPQQVDEFVHRTEEIYNDLLEQLRELKPPDSMRARVNQMLDQLAAVAHFLPQLQKAVAANDQGRTSDLVRQIGEASTVASEIASDLGLESCINAGNVAGPSISPTPTASF